MDIHPNYYVGETYDDDVEYMRAWILDRAAWLDGSMPGNCGG